MKCFKCHKELGLDASASISRSDECQHCAADIRCCKMCAHFDANSYNECREPMADRIIEKEKKNFCDFYKFGNSNEYQDQKNDLLAKANSLFK